MTQTAHIFNPQNDSLAEKVKAYQSVVDLLHSVEHSSEVLRTAKKNDTDHIGTEEEVQYAYKIACTSLAKALKEISESEIQTALEQELMTNEQAAEFMQFSRQQDMSSFRSTKRSIHSNSQSQKQ